MQSEAWATAPGPAAEKLPSGPPLDEIFAEAGAILRSAHLLLIRGGWLKPAGYKGAVDREGRQVHPTSPAAAVFSAGGSIVRASHDRGSHWSAGLCAQKLLELFSEDAKGIRAWNDARWVTPEVLEDAFLRAIWRAQNPQSWKSKEWAHANGI